MNAKLKLLIDAKLINDPIRQYNVMLELLFSTEQKSILAKFICIPSVFYNLTAAPTELQYSLVNKKTTNHAYSIQPDKPSISLKKHPVITFALSCL